MVYRAVRQRACSLLSAEYVALPVTGVDLNRLAALRSAPTLPPPLINRRVWGRFSPHVDNLLVGDGVKKSRL